MTVQGEVDAHQLGTTLMHEHVLVNLKKELGTVGLVCDERLMCDELRGFAAAGGQTVVDVTTAELSWGAASDPAGHFTLGVPDASGDPLGRSPANALALARIAADAGVHVVMGTGHYRDPYLDRAGFDRHDADRLAALMVTELVHGVGDTGVRAGIIGEIGSDLWYISAAEERSFRAAARAHRITGAPITTHAAFWPVGIAQLDLLTAEGVDPARIIIGHADTVNIPEYHLAIAQRGAYVQFDTIQGQTAHDIEVRVRFVTDLIAAGHLDRILLSHDICRRDRLRAAGGPGFTYILTGFTEALRTAGVTAQELETILVENPRRALAGCAL